MESYDEDYVAHNLPLILLSGLGTEPEVFHDHHARSKSILDDGGFRIKVDAPDLTDNTAESLLQAFLAADSAEDPWNSRATSVKDNGGCFRIKRVGRVGQTPFTLYSGR